MKRFWQRWLQENQGTPIEFVLETIDDELQHGNATKIQVICTDTFLGISGNGQGMRPQSWNYFTKKLFDDSSSMGIAIFGEGARRVGYTLSPSHEFWTISNYQNLIQNAHFFFNSRGYPEAKRNISPSWIPTSFIKSRQKSSGVTYVVNYPMNDSEINKLVEDIRDAYGWLLYSSNISIEVVKQLGQKIPITAPNYGTTQIETPTLKGSQIPSIIFKNPVNSKESGAIKFFFCGRKVYEPQRKRMPVISWIDITNLVGVRTNLNPTKDNFKTSFITTKIDPLINQIYSKYGNLGNSSGALALAANQLYRMMSKAQALGIQRFRKTPMFEFWCINPLCLYYKSKGFPLETHQTSKIPNNCPICQEPLILIGQSKSSSNSIGRKNKTKQSFFGEANLGGEHFVVYAYPESQIDIDHILYPKLLALNCKSQTRDLAGFLTLIREVSENPYKRNSTSECQALQVQLDKLAKTYVLLEK